MSFFDPRERESLSSRILLGLYRISQGIHLAIRKEGVRRGLSPSQMEVLLFLKFSRPGVRTVGGVAQRLKVSYGTASEVVQYLVKKRKVRKVVKGNDLRKVFLELTPSGDRLASSLSRMLADIEGFLRELPEETLLSLKGGLEKVVSILHERGYITVYEMCWHCSFFRENFYPEDPRFPHFCQFMKKPLSPEVTYLECPDFLPREKVKV